MGKIIKLQPREKFYILKRKYPKILSFLTKEEQEKIQKEKEDAALIRYILENSPNF